VAGGAHILSSGDCRLCIQQWRKFFQEDTLEKIPNKVDSTLYAVYTG
jgi:hypothetical protein